MQVSVLPSDTARDRHYVFLGWFDGDLRPLNKVEPPHLTGSSIPFFTPSNRREQAEGGLAGLGDSKSVP